MGSAPVKGARTVRSGQRERLGYHAASTVASANLAGNSAVTALFLR